MSSESERRFSMEELKQLNKPQALEASMPPPPPMIILPEADWNTLLNQLDRLEAQAAAQEALLRALTRQVGQLPTQVQLEALTRDVAQIRETLQQAGRKREISISPPSLETALSVLIWLILILLGTMVGMVVLQTIWSGLAALWSAVRILIP